MAQMVLTPVIKMELEETDNLLDTLRGEGGFGSTGKWKPNWIKKQLNDFQDK